MTVNVLYFDEVNPAFKHVIQAAAPASVSLYFAKELSDESLENHIKEADAFLVATEKISGSTIEKAENLKFIQKTGVGVDNIDVETASKKGIPVANTPGMNAAGVAELTILLTLALYRKLPYVHEQTTSGNWPMWSVRTSSFEMEGKTHGLIGLGNIGKEVAKRSQAFGTSILYFDKLRLSKEEETKRNLTYVSLNTLIKESDILSVHVPLLPETRHIIGNRELKTMKSSAILVNVSRGGTVDEKALAEALQYKKIAGAAVDVWEEEPVPKENPLLSMEEVIATSHIGAGTKDTLNKVLGTAFQNIERFIQKNEALFIINDDHVHA
ncbi:2-hydroxyacid dehydrogenase [Alteribacillus sp. JSM 102045]|uniref:2-hydroxyacid dehydrogenase n=1 Tax=Alteribacillus sp. JSM 102045 TaxID=1562101 RepID=UPI0035BF31EE